MIKYLLKFVTMKTHADALLNGELFMRPACYYWKLEKGQGDVGEAAISHEIGIYTHSHVPIYCTYAVDDKDIVDDSIIISKRCIEDFKCENGYVVILNYQKFEYALTTLLSGGYEVDAGLVNYHKLTFEDIGHLIVDNTPKNLFVKHPFFAYQKEFRIVVCKALYKLGEPPIDSIIYRFPSDLRDMAIYKEIAGLKHEDHSVSLLLSKEDTKYIS